MLGKSFIYVGGVPGAGKTTLCRALSQKMDLINYISSGEIKRPEARRRYGMALSKLDQTKTFKINEWFFKNLFRKNKNGIYLVDTHYTYPLPDQNFVNLCPERIAGRMNLFFLIEANYEEIAKRRINRGRDRDSVNEDFIKIELEREKHEALRLSEKFNISLVILKNEGDLESSILNFSCGLKY